MCIEVWILCCFYFYFFVFWLSHPSCVTPYLISQTLRESDTLLCDESCLALLSEAESRQSQYSGLLTDARPATTQSYIYIHKTEENGEICHTFCYCLETDRWKELATGHGKGVITMPDPPGSCLTSYAEKVLKIMDLNCCYVKQWFSTFLGLLFF